MPACLADSSMGDEALGGQTVTVSGWGLTSSGGTQATVLQSVNVPAMTNAECRNTGYGENQITDAMMCAGQAEGGIDSCQGDSGGNVSVEVYRFDTLIKYNVENYILNNVKQRFF